jgi:hypothetical protein
MRWRTWRAPASARPCFEGVDRCGKTTQCSRLVEALKAAGVEVELWRYPDRTTAMGQMINSYLQSKTEMDDGKVRQPRHRHVSEPSFLSQMHHGDGADG